jgi:integrase
LPEEADLRKAAVVFALITPDTAGLTIGHGIFVRRDCLRNPKLIAHELGGKEHEVPCHYTLEKYLDEYVAAAEIAGDAEGLLFRTTGRKTGHAQAMWQQDAYRMIQRRAADAGIKTRIGNHTFRATGITAYLKNKGTLEHAQTIANHSSPRTTKLYDRRSDEISLDEVEKIAI